MTTPAAAPTGPVLAQSPAAPNQESGVQKFISILDFIGTEVEKVLTFVVQYEVPIESFVSALFPPGTVITEGVIAAVNLIQKAILEIKQKSSALPTALTDTQMLADELALCGPTVIAMLAKDNIVITQAQLSKMILAVVAILNTQPAPTA